MNGIIDAFPTAVQHHEGTINFYYGVHPSKIQYLPPRAEFTVVYGPKDGDSWQMVTYRTFEGGSGMAVIERRDLEPKEVEHFEYQARLSKHDTGTTPALGNASV